MADLMQQARAELAVTAQENMRKARALFDDNLIDAREVAGQFSDWLRVNAACQAKEFPEAAGQLSATAELIDRLAAALRAAPEWQPIETAPEGKLIVVAWLDDEGGERQEFDYIEDGMWIHHADLVEHAQMVAPPGSKMPKEQPPYQWWMDLPVLPAARPQGVEDA